MQINKIRKPYVWFVFGIYLLTLFKITVFRSGFSLGNILAGGHINLIPFADYFIMLRSGRILSFVYLFVGNIVWFVPFGFIVPLLCRRKRTFWLTAGLGFLLTCTIEVLQYIFGTGFSETDDLILNTMGVLLGYCVSKLASEFGHKLRKP